jgi:hypothetical protein
MQLSSNFWKISTRQRLAMTVRHVITADSSHFYAYIYQNILTILQGVAAHGVEVFAQVLIEFCIVVEVGLIQPCSIHLKSWTKFEADGVTGCV